MDILFHHLLSNVVLSVIVGNCVCVYMSVTQMELSDQLVFVEMDNDTY